LKRNIRQPIIITKIIGIKKSSHQLNKESNSDASGSINKVFMVFFLSKTIV
jgi:hypothetical protein